MNRPLPAPARDIALLLARLLIGVVMFAHGYQKMIINGIGRTTDGFETMSIPLAIISASFVTVVEFVGSALLIVGALTPLIAALILVIMGGAAIFVHIPHGIFVGNGGWELVGVIAAGVIALAATGPGRYSIDHMMRGRQMQHQRELAFAGSSTPGPQASGSTRPAHASGAAPAARAPQPAPVFQEPAPVFQDAAPVYQEAAPIFQDAAPVYQDAAPVHQEAAPVYQDAAPAYRGSAPVYQGPAPAYQEAAPVYQGSAPAYQGHAPVYQEAAPIFQEATPASPEAAPTWREPAPAFQEPAPNYRAPR
jgi:putative oxidoreductase